MNARNAWFWLILAGGLGFFLALPSFPTAGADSSPSIPPIVQAGLAVYASGGPEPALSAWRKNGPLESDEKMVAQTDLLKQAEKSFGNYKTYELIETREIGRTSKMVYLSMNFQRGAVFASFQVYRASKDWVVQNMDFSTEPETIMPWLHLSARN